jgi:hypothetical protein
MNTAGEFVPAGKMVNTVEQFPDLDEEMGGGAKKGGKKKQQKVRQEVVQKPVEDDAL